MYGDRVTVDEDRAVHLVGRSATPSDPRESLLPSEGPGSVERTRPGGAHAASVRHRSFYQSGARHGADRSWLSSAGRRVRVWLICCPG